MAGYSEQDAGSDEQTERQETGNGLIYSRQWSVCTIMCVYVCTYRLKTIVHGSREEGQPNCESTHSLSSDNKGKHVCVFVD